MSEVQFILVILCNIVITFIICGWMNRKSAELLLKFYYEDRVKSEKRLTTLEYWHKSLL